MQYLQVVPVLPHKTQALPSKEKVILHVLHLSVAEHVAQPSEQAVQVLVIELNKYPSTQEEHAFSFIEDVQVLHPTKQASHLEFFPIKNPSLHMSQTPGLDEQILQLVPI